MYILYKYRIHSTRHKVKIIPNKSRFCCRVHPIKLLNHAIKCFVSAESASVEGPAALSLSLAFSLHALISSFRYKFVCVCLCVEMRFRYNYGSYCCAIIIFIDCYVQHFWLDASSIHYYAFKCMSIWIRDISIGIYIWTYHQFGQRSKSENHVTSEYITHPHKQSKNHI